MSAAASFVAHREPCHWGPRSSAQVQPKVGGTIATMKVKACREVVDSFVCEGLGRRFEKGCVVEATFWAMNVDARGVGGSWRFHRGDLTAQKPPPCCEITGARS